MDLIYANPFVRFLSRIIIPDRPSLPELRKYIDFHYD